MSAHAALSPVDPFVGSGARVLRAQRASKGKPIAKVEDETVICADIARKMLDEAKRVTCELMHSRHDHDGRVPARRRARLAASSRATGRSRRRPRRSVGLNVSAQMPSRGLRSHPFVPAGTASTRPASPSSITRASGRAQVAAIDAHAAPRRRFRQRRRAMLSARVRSAADRGARRVARAFRRHVPEGLGRAGEDD